MGKSVMESERPFMWYGKFCWTRHPLYRAIKENNLDIVRRLIEVEDENANVGRNSPLMLAIECGFEHISLYLLEHCYDPLCPDGLPLRMAIKGGHISVCLGIMQSDSIYSFQDAQFNKELDESRRKFPRRKEMLNLIDEWISEKTRQDCEWLLT
jgi:hypothetical protein